MRVSVAWRLAGAAAALLSASAHAHALSAEQVYARVAPSVWRVLTYDADNLPLGQGSGVVIADESVVTNCHVLAKAKRLAVKRETVSHDAKLVLWDVKRDVCQLKVAGLKAPAVTVTDSSKIAVGQNVFAIGNPKGLELTMSAGLVSSLRRNDAGQLILIQTSAAISSGSSGGGLFNDEGALIGLTTIGSITGDAQNLNFAIPSDWVRELPVRHAAAAASAATAGRDNAAPGGAGQPLKRGDRIVYRVTDRLTGVAREAVYTVDSLDKDQVSFNQGGRIERQDGSLVSMTAPVAGEMDNCMPPGGWSRPGMTLGQGWSIEATRPTDPCAGTLSMRAYVATEEQMNTPLGTLMVQRVDFKGSLASTSRAVVIHYSVQARAWYAPALGRTVRFEIDAVPNYAGLTRWREMAELTAIRRD
jgi:serine protease Do